MSSAGQIIGGAVGAIAGFMLPGVGWAIGAQIGMMAGGYLDPPKGPNLVGPRLSDLSAQGASYGATIPRVYGSAAILGNIFWIENNALKEVSTTTESGGKGAPSSSQTTYSYFATFAIGLCEGPIAGVRRIWINNTLYYDAGSSDISTVFASNSAAAGFRIYYGTDTQTADPRMQATLGVANTPAYRGLAYIVFDDFPLEKYGNSLVAAQIKVEILSAASYPNISQVNTCGYTQPFSNVAFSAQPVYIGIDCVQVAAGQWYTNYPATSSINIFDIYANSAINAGSVICPGTSFMPNQQLSKGKYLYSSLQVFTQQGFAGPSGFIAEADNLYAGISSDSSGGIYVSRGSPATQVKIARDNYCAITTDGNYVWVVGPSQSIKCDSNLNILQTGAGLSGVVLGVSRLWYDSASDALYACASFVSPFTIYKFSSDLSSVSVFASGLTATGWDYYNVNFIVYENIVIVARGGRADADSSKYAKVTYFSVNAVSNTTVTLGDVVASETTRAGLLALPDIDTTTLTDQVRGYRIAQVAALRAGIEPLQGAWPFDVIQSGYQIKFKRRGTGSSVATIDATQLGARDASEGAAITLSTTREMDTQLPWRVEINHLDFDREYDINTQYAERLNAASVNVSKIDLPVVMTADEAAQKAEILLYTYWLERTDVAFKLPPEYAYLEPADVITVNAPTGNYVLRLTSLSYNSNGVIECRAKVHSFAGYSSTATGSTSLATFPQTIAYPGPITYALLDIPLLDESYDTPSFYTTMCALNGSWVGGSLWKSIDGGQTFNFTNVFTNQGSIGYTTNFISAPEYFGRIDRYNQLAVKFYYGAPSSVSEIQLFAGANHFAYGADGRWEIIAAQTCTLQADGSYLLSDLLRGRFGSERAASSHAAGDIVVALTTAQVQLCSLSSSYINSTLTYRGIVDGQNLQAATNTDFKYTGVNLKPLSPVYLNGSITPSTNDWTITWVRRTRTSGEWLDYVDAALGETSESYDVEIYSSSAFDTLKRTFSGLTSATCTYTSAQQVADFGGNQTQLYVKVYQNSALVGRGYPLARPLPYTDGTVILMHCNGAEGGNVFIDEMGKTIGAVGTMKTTSDVAGSYGVTSAKFDGAGYLTWPAGLPALSDFTLEWRHYGAIPAVLWSVDANSFMTTTSLRFNGSAFAYSISNGSTSWCHIAIVRNGSTVKIYKNGVALTTFTYSTAVNFSTLYWGIYKPNMNQYMTGRMDEIRLSSRAVYLSDFTPPVSEFSVNQGAW